MYKKLRRNPCSGLKQHKLYAALKQVKAALTSEKWVGTDCVFQAASRRVSIEGELRGLINEVAWLLRY